MSKNIKEIGKELLGKSLNSFHRKTGLTQLEKNNEMQDGILDGILSQVDDAYIEKTEQSNVIHLDGSGDGVVVLDGIEGNTMVNCISTNINQSIKFSADGTAKRFDYKVICKGNATYTLVANITKNTINNKLGLIGWHIETNNKQVIVPNGFVGLFKQSFTTKADISENWYMDFWKENTEGEIELNNFMVLEGDWTNKEVPSYFEGLQSSFEEKVNDEDKYEIEILSNNRNLCNNGHKYENWTMVAGGQYDKISNGYILDNSLSRISKNRSTLKNLKNGETYTISFDVKFLQSSSRNEVQIYLDGNGELYGERIRANGRIKWTFVYNSKYHNIGIYNQVGSDVEHLRTEISNIIIEKTSNTTNYIQQKHNKIKLLINEPLRSTTLGKDRLCIVDGKLMIERKNKQIIICGEERYRQSNLGEVVNCAYFEILDMVDAKKRTQNGEVYCDKLPSLGEINKLQDKENIFCDPNYNLIGIKISRSKLTTHDIDGIKTYFRNNNTKLCYPLAEPYYEEVLNEYGEPILLEGYENGTIYIDSTIVPTTTVRYTPKMESLNTLKEVNNNNVMLANDINDNIIPYMMDVDLMIMEKEMALPSQINTRKMEVLDMTSMQKRTQDMLERLIKGKTLTEQECKTRVTTYLNAGKITDEQAKELNFLIDEIYA